MAPSKGMKGIKLNKASQALILNASTAIEGKKLIFIKIKDKIASNIFVKGPAKLIFPFFSVET